MKGPMVKNKINCMEDIWETRKKIEISESSVTERNTFGMTRWNIVLSAIGRKKGFKFLCDIVSAH